MAKQPAVSDETLARALGVYAGMVDKVISDPERWLGPLDGPDISSSGVPGRLLDTIRDHVLGEVTPASDDWAQQPVDTRVDWWVDRIGVSAGLAAAAPRFAGALADRVPLQAALGASAAGLAVCATAREHAVVDPQSWVPLLAKVLLDRDLPTRAAEVPPPEEAERALVADLDDAATAEADDRGKLAAVGQGAQRAGRTLWRLARTFTELQNLLDERPRGGFLARTLAKLPVVGVAGGWLDERSAIRKAAAETQTLLAN
ncbi:MAG TPA: hypothetical protein VEQ66_03545 [Propionibacteriaceae bacterium]|nr:hypothetical protein [Propionibacteriaceae bacterium]